MKNIWSNLSRAKRDYPVGTMVNIGGENWPVIDYSLRSNGSLYVVVNWDGYSYYLGYQS